MLANACASQSITFATAYDSLGEDGLTHSINEPEVYGMFSNANLLGTIAAVVGKTPSLKVLVYDGEAKDVKAGALDTIKAANGGIKVYTFDEFLQLGKDKPSAPNPPKPEDLACIMYTSGSTGTPKGVQISNANIVACRKFSFLQLCSTSALNLLGLHSRSGPSPHRTRRQGGRDLHRIPPSRAHHGVRR